MRVRIVCYEDVHQWIIGKFALRMQEYLLKMNIEVDIEKTPDPNADINHHIIYGSYEVKEKSTAIDTLMITHIDDIAKLKRLKNQMQYAELGICMSRETMINLTNLGIPRNKLCYINPAHDGVIKPRKIIVGITCRVQKDGRKREFMVDELAKNLNPTEFEFKIMGEFWSPQVINLRKNGFTVDYFENFDYTEYVKLIPSLDYYLYTGTDEGQMGFIDALAAGVQTIVTPQGYHFDADGGISYSFTSMNELLDCFKAILQKRNGLTSSVENWNWENYTKKHLELWRYLLSNKSSKDSLDKYSLNSDDGLNSLAEFSKSFDKTPGIKKLKLLVKLNYERIRHYYYSKRNINRKD